MAGLPPDVRQQLEKQRSGAPGGVGSGAKENLLSASARAAAMGVPVPEAEEAKPAAKESPAEDLLKTCPNDKCRTDLDDKWGFCAKCGTDLLRSGAAKRLGISFEDRDVEDYLFKGYITREIKVYNRFSLLIRSSQTSDTAEIDTYLMGRLKEHEKAGGGEMSQFLYSNLLNLAYASMAVAKLNGESTGETLAQRMAWFESKGSAFVDLVWQKVTLFNRAWTEYLRKQDSISGS